MTEGVQAMQGLDDRAALRALIEWAVLGPDARTHQLWLALVLGAATDPALRAELDRFNEWWSAQLRDRVARVCPDDPVGAADVLDVFVDGLSRPTLADGAPCPPVTNSLVCTRAVMACPVTCRLVRIGRVPDHSQ